MKPEQMSSDQLEKFLAYYRKRIDQDPENVEARLRLATIFRETGRKTRAIEQYEEAAELLGEQGLAREAIEACKAILELDASKVEAKYLLARLYAATPEATDGGARVAKPVEEDDETYELTEEADPRREELIETDEFDPEEENGGPLERPDPAETDRRAEEKQTRVADYGESPEEFADARSSGEVEALDGDETVQLTPEEQERRDGFSREEMEELLTTIDVGSEDIVEVEDLDEYELDEDESEEGVDPAESADIKLGAELEVNNSTGGDGGDGP